MATGKKLNTELVACRACRTRYPRYYVLASGVCYDCAHVPTHPNEDEALRKTLHFEANGFFPREGLRPRHPPLKKKK